MASILSESLFSAGWVAITIGVILLIRSLLNFSRTGPKIRKEVQEKFFIYGVYALTRLAFWSCLVAFYLAFPGSLLSSLTCQSFGPNNSLIISTLAGIISFALFTVRQFLNHLRHTPGIIATSANFEIVRLHSIWQKLTVNNLKSIDFILLCLFAGPDLFFLADFLLDRQWHDLIFLFLLSLVYCLPLFWNSMQREPSAVPHQADQKYPNIVMIGSDTLRADHLSAYGYHRPTSPFLDKLTKRSTLFQSCYVPLARTAPSLVSLFTGCWPDTHGIKDNFISDAQTQNMNLPSLAACLEKAGYQTSTISDWAGGDLGKFKLGFQNKKLPEDQWNLKYLIKQGPKDIRLFLSLFCHNKFGKIVLPELYYLAGVPLTRQLGLEARNELAKLSKENRPFLLNLFMGTTHPPFSSNYPYYQLFSDPNYQGRSKFCMSRLTSPEEIIESQQEPRDAFDLDQIIALYDGSIRQFDDEVQQIFNYIEKCGLNDNTIIVIYSDHGMELFEHDTWGQGNSINGDSSAHIPLIIHSHHSKLGTVHREKVRSIDIMPTLLDLCGVNIPETVQGVSLKPVIEGEAINQELTVLYETGIWLSTPPKQKAGHITYPDIFNLLEIPNPKSGTLSISPEYVETIESARDWLIWRGPWKLKCFALNNGPHYELYNTDNDPFCRNNIAEKDFGIVEKLLTAHKKLMIKYWEK
ncbi:sulfatase-like hydrolase/transferase [Methylomarinum sp. Ch1-1]|uniref:Sulfatase-like hydrolase/transferase n=1 Tax=Methylomarinum roseum TaxID=3067653 RepID=A0AAU7NPJ9_9GAMM|nr:sulfatase-like hydrolase/transferase [Methylomarinum sp. Ch1-1]MDP4521206.1 sulfatase-like hydrolase/transferase [Methylomarinum sp. Ch1-1]